MDSLLERLSDGAIFVLIPFAIGFVVGYMLRWWGLLLTPLPVSAFALVVAPKAWFGMQEPGMGSFLVLMVFVVFSLPLSLVATAVGAALRGEHYLAWSLIVVLSFVIIGELSSMDVEGELSPTDVEQKQPIERQAWEHEKSLEAPRQPLSPYRLYKFSDHGAFLGGWGDSCLCRGIAVDSSGNVYVSEWAGNRDRIQKFAADGSLLATYGSTGKEPGQFHNPLGIALDAAGNIYVADAGNRRVQKLSASGEPLAQWGSPYLRFLIFLVDVAVDSAGNVYVVERNNPVQVFSSEGTPVTKWPIADDPHGIALDRQGNVYITASYNTVQKFSPTGTLLVEWGSFGVGDGQFRHPIGIAVDASGNVYVADQLNSRVQVFTSNGGFLRKWPAWGRTGGEFPGGPSGIAVDNKGNVYITRG